MAKSTKKVAEKVDGISPKLNAKIRNAVRKLWHQSYARKLVVDRCTGFDGWTYCEDCERRCPKLKIDHIINVGAVDSGFLERMFVASKGLRGLCAPCHQIKTNKENANMRAAKKIKKGPSQNTPKHRHSF